MRQGLQGPAIDALDLGDIVYGDEAQFFQGFGKEEVEGGGIDPEG
jgi:hypothetical protein